MLSLLLSLSLSTNFTDALYGSWNITAIEVTDNSDSSPVPRGYRINFQPSGEPGVLSGDLYGEDDGGEPVLLSTVFVSPNEESNTTLNVEISAPDTPEARHPLTSLTFKHGVEDVYTVTGFSSDFGTFSIVAPSSTIIEATVFNPEVNVTTTYRCVKDVPRQNRPIWTTLLPMLPTLLMMCMGGGRMGAPPQAAAPAEAKAKTD